LRGYKLDVIMTKSGRLIAFEGIDGAGKKTLTRFLKKQLTKEGMSVETFRYPDYGSPWGRIIKRYLDNKLELDPVEQFFTYFTDILKDQAKLEELLAKGDFVIVDRYFASTVAFQSAQGFSYRRALAVLDQVKPIIPDIGFFIEVAPKTAMQRCQRRTPPDRHERDLALLTAVAKQYWHLVYDGVLAKRWLVLDGNKSLDVIKTKLSELMTGVMASWES
jgi:dTMP kinase